MKTALDLFFDDFWTPSLTGAGTGLNTDRRVSPACDIEESDSHYLLSLDMPGVAREDIKIEVSGGELRVSGERKSGRPDPKSSNVRFTERHHGFWTRSFSLPEGIDQDHIEALYENGVLKVAVPKSAKARPREIPVQAPRAGGRGEA